MTRHGQCEHGGRARTRADLRQTGADRLTVWRNVNTTKRNGTRCEILVHISFASWVTLLAHFLTSVVSSVTTMSTHFRLGAFSLRICFFTMASKARSGVNSPVLRERSGKREKVSRRRGDREGKRERGKKKRRRKLLVINHLSTDRHLDQSKKRQAVVFTSSLLAELPINSSEIHHTLPAESSQTPALRYNTAFNELSTTTSPSEEPLFYVLVQNLRSSHVR